MHVTKSMLISTSKKILKKNYLRGVKTHVFEFFRERYDKTVERKEKNAAWS